MPEISLRLVTTMGRPIDIVLMPADRGGTPFRWRSGAYDVDVAEADARKLLGFLAGHYVREQGAFDTTGKPALVIQLSVAGELIQNGQGIQEALRLVGIAITRLQEGVLSGRLSDKAGVRHVSWNLV